MSAAYILSSLDCPSLARSTGLVPFSPDFAKFLGMLASVVLPATQLVVMAVSFLVAQQPAMLMAMAVGRANLLELQPWVLRD